MRRSVQFYWCTACERWLVDELIDMQLTSALEGRANNRWYWHFKGSPHDDELCRETVDTGGVVHVRRAPHVRAAYALAGTAALEGLPGPRRARARSVDV